MTKISLMLKEIVDKEKVTTRGLGRAIDVDHVSLIRSFRKSGNPESRTIETILDHLRYDLKFIKRKEVKKEADRRYPKVIGERVQESGYSLWR